MSSPNIQNVPFRRKREGKTNYKKRFRLVGSEHPRLVIRLTNTKVIAQIVTFEEKGDKVLVATDSRALLKLGWKGSVKNLPAAYATGFLLAKKAQKAGISNAITDIGFHTSIPGVRVYAALKGAVDGGLTVPVSEDIFPSDERINGSHIEGFSNNVESVKQTMEKSA